MVFYLHKLKSNYGLIGMHKVRFNFFKWVLVSYTIGPLSLFDSYNLRLKNNESLYVALNLRPLEAMVHIML